MCTDTRGQWNLSCQQGLSRRVGQRCNFDQHLKFIIFPNVNSNTRGEFELWVCMIFCTYLPPHQSNLLFLNGFFALFWRFPSQWCSFELIMCYIGVNNISSNKTVKKHSVTSYPEPANAIKRREWNTGCIFLVLCIGGDLQTS